MVIMIEIIHPYKKQNKIKYIKLYYNKILTSKKSQQDTSDRPLFRVGSEGSILLVLFQV